MASILFSPIELRGLTLKNRIVVAPMCMYSAEDGVANDWHLMHMGQFAVSGCGAFLCEATAVTPEGRISDRCLALHTDEQEAALTRVVSFCHDWGNAAVGIQLAHAGRKGSSAAPGTGRPPGPLTDAAAWQTVAPSPLPFGENWPVPDELDEGGIAALIDAFAKSAQRAARIGFDLIELHAAHGYLMHQFLSPLSNRRTDSYGGSLENRMRFPLEVFSAVRAAFPDDKPVGVRISATDWIDSGWTCGESIALAKALEAKGCDFLHVSSGGTSMDAVIPAGPGYQVPLAQEIRAAVAMPVIAVGQITEARQAETIVRTGQADMVALARAMLFNPHWTWQAATELEAETAYPFQYARCHPKLSGMPIPPGKPPAEEMTGERSTRATSPLGILAVVIVATALAPLSMHIIIPSIPGFQDAFGVSYATAQLAIPLFLIGMAGAQLVHGPLSDRFGRRPVMLVGLIVNLLGSALCMVAPTIEILIAGRFVQAVGGCVGMVVGRAIIRDLFDRRRTASLLAYVTMVMVVAPMLAPAIGGILDEWQGWQAPLAFLLVAGVIAFAATLRWLPETLAEPGGGLGFASIPGDFAFLLRQRRFIGYAFGLSFTSVTFFAFVGGAPYVTVELLGASPSDYGLFFMPVVASYMLGNFISARLTQRVGIDRMITMGMIIVVTGGTGALILHLTGHTTAVTLFGGMAFMALGHGFCIPNQLAGAVSINPRLSGSAAGLSGSLQIGMGALASAVTGALMADSAVPMAVVMFLGALGLLAVHVWGVLTAPAVAAGDGN